MLNILNRQKESYKTIMQMPIQPNGLKGRLMFNEPMSKHTSWRVGGIADRLYVPHDLDDLVTFIIQLDEDEPLTWIGLGSNLLVRDGGIRGTVIATKNMEDKIEIVSPNLINVSVGTACGNIAKYCEKTGLNDAQFLVGIPGTLGGALAMNAGAFGSETWDIVKSVLSINRKGEIKERHKEEYKVSYRSISKPANEWFISAILELSIDNNYTGKNKLRDLLKKRNDMQPVGVASCGSVFRNPNSKNPAARLIEACGLKGKTVGNASISEKHANFIINTGKAKAIDIENLILQVQKIVYEQYKLKLMPEVKIIGEEVKDMKSRNKKQTKDDN
ncbi:MAG: UDP-N-acetylmuramate dehydrogenase [Gammaproteobacteria bacterium]|jgi:UDP-N-acetylmuramate dehydrogenase